MPLETGKFYKIRPREIGAQDIVPNPDDPGPFGKPNRLVEIIERAITDFCARGSKRLSV